MKGFVPAKYFTSDKARKVKTEKTTLEQLSSFCYLANHKLLPVAGALSEPWETSATLLARSWSITGTLRPLERQRFGDSGDRLVLSHGLLFTQQSPAGVFPGPLDEVKEREQLLQLLGQIPSCRARLCCHLQLPVTLPLPCSSFSLPDGPLPVLQEHCPSWRLQIMS